MKPPRLNPSDVANFKTIRRAMGDGALALVSAVRKADRKPVALVCAMGQTGDGAITPVPLAVMVEGDPYEDFEDPTT
jgi:hypothetical protein